MLWSQFKCLKKGEGKMRKVLIFAIAICLTMCYVNTASAVLLLPDPDTVVDGVVVASQYDDFRTYPASLMIELANRNPGDPNVTWTAADWFINTGTGGLDLLVYTGAAGQKNDPVSTGQSFEDPLIEPNPNKTNSFDGTWGLADPTFKHSPIAIDGPVYVDDILTYLELKVGEGATIPVFNFDMTEPQGGKPSEPPNYLTVSGQARIVDPDTNATVKFWAFDNEIDDIYNMTDWVYAPNWLEVPGTSGNYTIRNNVGGGKLDYAVFAPDMDLSEWSSAANGGKRYKYAIDIHFREIEGSSEELYLTGAFAAPGTEIPEPVSAFLVGIGLLGLGIFKKRR